jgi:hypothetical protein
MASKQKKTEETPVTTTSNGQAVQSYQEKERARLAAKEAKRAALEGTAVRDATTEAVSKFIQTGHTVVTVLESENEKARQAVEGKAKDSVEKLLGSAPEVKPKRSHSKKHPLELTTVEGRSVTDVLNANIGALEAKLEKTAKMNPKARRHQGVPTLGEQIRNAHEAQQAVNALSPPQVDGFADLMKAVQSGNARTDQVLCDLLNVMRSVDNRLAALAAMGTTGLRKEIKDVLGKEGLSIPVPTESTGPVRKDGMYTTHGVSAGAEVYLAFVPSSLSADYPAKVYEGVATEINLASGTVTVRVDEDGTEDEYLFDYVFLKNTEGRKAADAIVENFVEMDKSSGAKVVEEKTTTPRKLVVKGKTKTSDEPERVELGDFIVHNGEWYKISSITRGGIEVYQTTHHQNDTPRTFKNVILTFNGRTKKKSTPRWIAVQH